MLGKLLQGAAADHMRHANGSCHFTSAQFSLCPDKKSENFKLRELVKNIIKWLV